MTQIKELNIHCDGGARGNPGPAAIGAYATVNQQHLFSLSEYIGQATNNVAEYTAVIRSLEYLLANHIKAQQVNFFLDSQLIVKQLSGEYKIKQPHLQKLHLSLRRLLHHLNQQQLCPSINFTHVKRELNKQSDALVNQALDQQLLQL